MRRFRTLKSIPGDLQTHALAGRIAAAGAGCVWVGPVYGDVNSPYHKANDRVQELSQFLSQSVAPCRYIDSTRFETGAQWPTTDGQHLTVAGYRQWGQNIAEAVGQIKKNNSPRDEALDTRLRGRPVSDRYGARPWQIDVQKPSTVRPA